MVGIRSVKIFILKTWTNLNDEIGVQNDRIISNLIAQYEEFSSLM